jgi:hypothetical protein
MRFAKPAAATALMLMGMFGPAHASTLIGNTVNANYYYPTFGANCCGDVSFSPTSFTVGSGSETTLTFGSTPITFDFAASSLTITFGAPSTTPRSDPPGAFNGPSFTDVNGANFGTIASITGGPIGTVTDTGNVLSINWAGVPFTDGETAVITFANAVPESSTWAMMILGFCGLGFMTYRRKQQGPAFRIA